MERPNQSSAKIWKHKVTWLPVGLGSWSCWGPPWCWEAQSPGSPVGHSRVVLHRRKQCRQRCSLAKGHLSSLPPRGLARHPLGARAAWEGMHLMGWGPLCSPPCPKPPRGGGVLQLSVLQPGHEQGFLVLGEGTASSPVCGQGRFPFC